MGGIGVKIWYTGQPARCYVCVNGHVTAECPLKGLCRSCKQEGNIARNYPSEAWCRLQADNAAERSADPIPAEAQHLASGPTGSSSTAAKRAKNTTDYRQNEKKNYSLQTEKKLTDYRHGPPLSIFVFRKKRSEEHFVFFLAYEVTTLKVIIEFPVIFLLFGRKLRARDHFAEQFPVFEPTKPPAVIFQPRCLFIRSSREWNHKSDSEFFPKRRRSRNRTPP